MCDLDNFLSDTVVKQVNNDSQRLSSFVNLIKRLPTRAESMNKGKIWKPDKIRLSRSIL